MSFMANSPEVQRAMLLMVLCARYNGSATKAEILLALQELGELKRRDPAPEVLQSLNMGWDLLFEQGFVRKAAAGDAVELTETGKAKAQEFL